MSSPFGVQRVAYWVMVGTTVVYGVLGLALKGTVSGAKPPELLWALMVVGLLSSLAGVLLYRRLDDPDVSGPSQNMEQRKRLSAGLAWTLIEATAVCGLVMMILDGPGIYLIAGSLVLLLLHRPKRGLP